MRFVLDQIAAVGKYCVADVRPVPSSMSMPDWVKSQPWNIKAMPEGPVGAEMHGRLTGSYKGKPQFNAVERYVHGTPTWSKVGAGAAVGHPAGAAKAQSDKRR